MEDHNNRTEEQPLSGATELRHRISELEEPEAKANKLLKEKEEVLEALLNATHESLLLVDREGTVLLSNAIGAQRLTKTVDQLIGTCLYDHFPAAVARVRKKQVDRAVATGEPGYLEDARTGRFFESYYYPVFNEEGKVDRVVIFAHEITGRKHADKALREAERKYRSIFENAIEGIFQTTPGGQFLSANPAMARIVGYDSPRELIASVTNMETQLYVNPDDRTRFAALMQERGIVKDFEAQQYRKDGSVFWALIDALAVKDELGNILYFEGTYEDISARKESEKTLRETLNRLHRAIKTTIQTMASIVETKDPYTAGHQRRTTDIALAIATEMHLPPEKIEGIGMAGFIHDIGKISVPAEILAKSTRISAIEFELIKSHAEAGYEILKNVECPWPLAEIVLQHHERMDGSGYPQGLKGNEITVEARILAVADVVESMASHRPYRPALGIDAALTEIEQKAGTLYDREVTETCLRLFREKGFGFT